MIVARTLSSFRYAAGKWASFTWKSLVAVGLALVILNWMSRPAHPRYVGGVMPAQVTQEDLDWVKGLRAVGARAPCCDLNDGAFVDADYHDGKWWVAIEGGSYPVPDDAVLKEPNRIGRPIAWWTSYLGAAGSRVIAVRCFIPGALG